MRIAVERGRPRQRRADDRDLRRARRRSGVGARSATSSASTTSPARPTACRSPGSRPRRRCSPRAARAVRGGRRLAMLATALAVLLAAAPASHGEAAAARVRRAGRAGEVRHAPRPREPRHRHRPADRAAHRRRPRAPQAGAAGRVHVPRRRAGRRRDPADGRRELDLERSARAARHPARRPARHRRLASAGVPAAAGEPGRRRDDQGLHRVAERRLDAVRVRCRRGRPRGRPRRARLPVARPLRHLVRRDARAGLPGASPALGSDGGPGRGDAPRRLLLGPVRRQRAARARPHGEALRPRACMRASVPDLAGAAPLADRGVEREAGSGRT